MPNRILHLLIKRNATLAGVDLRAVTEGTFPVYTGKRRLGYFSCKLGDASVSSLAAAITQAETGGNVKYNNPGNLELGNAGGLGTWSPDGVQQITIFPTLADGEAALQNQIQNIANGKGSYPPGATLSEVADIYTSGQANSGKGSAWANNVATILGVSPSTPFADLAGADGGTLTPDTGDLADTSDTIDLSSLDDGTDSTPSLSPYLLLAGAGLVAAWALDLI